MKQGLTVVAALVGIGAFDLAVYLAVRWVWGQCRALVNRAHQAKHAS